MAWFWMSLLTAVAWGLCYTCAEQAIKSVDKSAYLAISGVLNCLFWFVCLGMKSDRGTSDFASVKWWVIGGIVSTIVGNFLSLKAIELKNATYASVVEISYPVWCAVFAFVLLGQNPMTWKAAIGAALIFAGTALFVVGEK